MNSSTILSIEQMRATYVDQWLLIAFTTLDQNLNVLAGEVLAHSKNRDEIYAALDQRDGKSFAIEYTGTPDEDVAYLL
ncbi:hypothetical protein [Romeriopsis navalis]|nr:hypothetical protein [Romeriopsis navalis]